MKGKVILITGGNAGLGKAAATDLAQMGATIVILARDKERAGQAIEAIGNITGNPDLHVLLADLASLQSVRAAAEDFRKRFDRLDVLINNAAINVPTRTETVDGFETHFGVNYLSHYLLTRLLLDLLEQSAPSRIVNVGARQMGATLDFDDLQLKTEWTGLKAITRAKLAMFLFTRELARRLAGKNVTANILDPGLVKTNYHQQSGPILGLIVKLFGKKPGQAAETYVYLAASSEVVGVSGRFFSAGKEIPIKGQALDNAIAAKLWEVSAKAVGLD